MEEYCVEQKIYNKITNKSHFKNIVYIFLGELTHIYVGILLIITCF